MASRIKKTNQPSFPTAGPASASAGPKKTPHEPEPVIQKRVNTRFILISFAIVLVSAVGLHFVHAVQVERNAEHLKIRAEAAEAEGDYAKSAQLLGQYLTFRKDDLDALLHLIRLRDGLATNNRALQNVLLGYEEVLRRDSDRPDEAEIRQDLIAVAMSIGEYSSALHHLRVLLEEERYQDFREQDAKQTAELQYQRGRCHQAEGRTTEAFESFQAALKLNEGEHKYYLPTANLFAEESDSLPRREEKDVPETEFEEFTITQKIETLLPFQGKKNPKADTAEDQILSWMIENAAEPAPAYLARARYRYGQQDWAESRADVERSRSLDPEDKAMLLFSARLAADQAHNARLRGESLTYYGLIAQARSDVAEGIAQNPNAAGFHLLRSVIENEAREGLSFLPAVAEKTGAKRDYPDTLTDPVQQMQWTFYRNTESILREGLVAVQKSFEELKSQKPEHTRLRLRNADRPLNNAQLSQVGNQLRWSLADNLISQHLLVAGDQDNPPQAGPLTEVQDQLTNLDRANASPGMVDFLRARLLIVEKDWKEAAWTLEQTRLLLKGQSDLKNRIDLLLDRCHVQMGNPDQRLQVMERALGENPRWLPAILRLPEIYEQSNRESDALRAYTRIKELPGASLAIARLRLQEQLNKPVESRRWDAVYQALEAEKVSELENPASVAILHAETLALEGAQLKEQGEAANSLKKYQEAMKLLEAALETSPKEAKLWAASARLEMSVPFPENRPLAARIADARSILNDAREEIGDHVELRLVDAQIAAFLPLPEALSELSALEKADGFPVEEQVQLLEGLAQAHARLSLKSGDEKEKEAEMKRVLALHQQIAGLQPTKIEPQIELAELAYGQKDDAAMDAAIGRVERIEGETGPNGNYLKAIRLTLGMKRNSQLTDEEQRTVERARRLLRSAMRDRPFWAVLPRTMGSLEEAVGNLEGAMTHYEKAFELGERSRTMITTMVKYYTDHQRFEYADEFLRKLATDSPLLLSGDLARKQWQVAWRMRRFDEALGVASSVADDSRDYRDHIWEARIRFSRGERGENVVTSLEDACKLAPKEPAPWLALVTYHVRTGNTANASAAIERAKTNVAKNPPHLLPVTLGRCYELVNDRDKAEQSYQAALKASKDPSEKVRQQIILADFYSRTPGTSSDQQAKDVQKANAILNQLLDSSGDVPDYARDWARRRKALVAAFSGRYDDTQRALELLAKGRGKGDPSIEDLRIESRILNTRNRYRDRLELIEVLEALESKKAISPDEKHLLARTYENTNQWPKAQAKYRELLQDVGHESKTARADLLTDFAIALLNRKDVDRQEMLSEAQSLVQELERLEPKSFRAVTTRGLLLYRQGKGAEAVPLLQDYLKGLDVITPEQAFRDLVQQEKIDEALDYLQMQLDDKSAKQIVDHVRKLIAEKNQEEALAVLQRYILASDAVDSVQTTLRRVIARFLEEIQQYAAAEKVFRQFVKRSNQPESPLELAAFLARRNRINEALDLCDSTWSTCDPALVAKVSVGTLRSAKPTTAQIGRVEKHLNSALEKATDENRMSLISNMADLRDLQGRHGESINLYREVLKQNPNHPVALNNLAWLLSYQPQHHNEALGLIEQAMTLYGPQGAFLDTRGMISLRNGETQLALKYLNNAVEELPSGAVYFHLAQAELADGKKQSAQQAFQEAQSLDLDPVTDLHILEAADYERISKMFK